MTQRRRLILTAWLLVAALALAVSRLLGWLDGLGGPSEVRIAGSVHGTQGGAEPPWGETLVAHVDGSAASGPGPDWTASFLVIATVLVIAGLAAYFGLGALDARRGAVAVFILGWAVTALAAAAGEVVLRAMSPSPETFGWFAYAPLTGDMSLSPRDPSGGYGVLLGWLAGLTLLAAYLRTRPAAEGPDLSRRTPRP